MKVVPSARLTSALVLAVCSVVFGQEQPEAATPVPFTRPGSIAEMLAARRAAQKRPGPGLLNEWLRKLDRKNYDWDVGGQVRGRYESKEGFTIPSEPGSVDFLDRGADTSNDYYLLRSRFHLGYVQNPGARYYVEGQDSRAWNDKRNPSPDADSVDLRQAYGVFGDPHEIKATLTVGRQELSYGDERLIGADDWSNVGRVFDAVKLRYQKTGWWVDVFAARPVEVDDHAFNRWNDDDTLFGLYASTVSWLKREEVQSYVLYRTTSGSGALSGGPSPRDVFTFGARIRSLAGRYGGWGYESEVARQFGNINVNNLRVDQEGLAAHLAVHYGWGSTYGSPTFTVGYNYSSGDNSPTDGANSTFDSLFPTNHKLYGLMDFFSWQNLHQPEVQFAIEPYEGLKLQLGYRMSWLADTGDSLYDANGRRRGPATSTPGGGYGINPNYRSYVGSELDFLVSYDLTTWAGIQAGYGHFFVGDYVKQSLSGVGGAKDADFIYAQVHVNF